MPNLMLAARMQALTFEVLLRLGNDVEARMPCSVSLAFPLRWWFVVPNRFPLPSLELPLVCWNEGVAPE